MDDEKPATPQQQMLVMWVLWSAFLVGVCVMYQFLHQKNPPAQSGSQAWLAALVPVAGSLFLRWNVLPKIRMMQGALIVMVLGIALAETALFTGMFIFPAHQVELFVAAFLGIAQHAPIYARRLIAPPDL